MPKPVSAFAGFSSPNYTMVPDQLFDELLPDLSGAELKVLLYIMRRTFGFKKESDAISLNQIGNGIRTRDGRVLDLGTGLSKSTIAEATKSLEAKGAIRRDRSATNERGDEATTYTLNLVPATPTPPRVQKSDTPPYPKIGHPRVQKSDTQDTVVQDTDLSNIRKEKISKRETNAEDSDPYAATTIVIDEQTSPVEVYPERITPSHTTSLTAVGDVLAKHIKPRPTGDRGVRDMLLAPISQFAEEFGDQASLKSSMSRAANLFARSEMSQERFIGCLWEARAITRERLREAKGTGIRNKMSYFFSVLTERLGLVDAKASEESHNRRVSPPSPNTSEEQQRPARDAYSAPQHPSSGAADTAKSAAE
ncbi:MAG TPA: replication protein [Roseiflexaceae bacterium]|nr:replication protein [Roseiflexaceae bacterium]